MKFFSKSLALILLAGATTLANADEVKVAVAANFTAAMNEIAAKFEQDTGHKAVVSFGSTGKLYTQIKNGAPFEVFLAADQKRPEMLIKEGDATGEFTYAVGKLVLWSANPDLITDGEKVLSGDKFQKVSIANPKTAPYGAAAVEVMKALNLYDALSPKIVQGDSISQAYQFVASRNAEIGFVALSQVALKSEGSSWKIPQDLYTPIRQDAVLLNNGKDSAAAKALIEYLKGDAAHAVIEKYGYGIE